MRFDSSYLIYGLAVGWFTYHIFWMAMRIYQFGAFPRTYGTVPNLSLRDLAEAAIGAQRELPAFRLVIPAYQEVAVIEATLRRAASMNYPGTHFQVCVVTYEDEAPTEAGLTTAMVARKVADELNEAAGLDLVLVLSVPAGFDGFFPGELAAAQRYIGKARGLNFALRQLHESNERNERILYIGLMRRLGHAARIERCLQALARATDGGDRPTLASLLRTLFAPGSAHYLGPLVVSAQVEQLVNLAAALQAATGGEDDGGLALLTTYLAGEAPRFFFEVSAAEAGGQGPCLRVATGKRFLFEAMREIERRGFVVLEREAAQCMESLSGARPRLHAALSGTQDPDTLFQHVRRTNTRWVMVYDADADPPPDVMRHLAARILTEPDVMGFQGPVAPLLNYDDVHPLCRMGALWMSFWHGAAYPRLLHNRYWAHPLAGTNWCFRVDGFERCGRLIRDCRYDEAKRRFLLHFDPRQLTEDLEAGVRNFSEWSVNAQWHPLVEMEQVPPTASAMFRQHTRWALGTLQTMATIVRSRLPITQKTWFLLYPLRVIFASSGPFITLALVIAVAGRVLQVAPIFAWWTLALAVGNLVYVWAFVRTFERYYDMRQRSAAIDYLLHYGPDLLRQLRDGTVGIDAAQLAQVRLALARATGPQGFAGRYLAARCTDNDAAVQGRPDVAEYAARLLRETPQHLHFDSVIAFVRAIDAGGAVQGGAGTLAPRAADWSRFADLVHAAATTAGAGRWPRWSRYHTQILIWAIPFIYFSVTPFFSAFWRWSTGQRSGWNKTMRTPKP